MAAALDIAMPSANIETADFKLFRIFFPLRIFRNVASYFHLFFVFEDEIW